MKNKILYIFALMLFALILFATNVNAAEYSDSDKSVIITMNDLGVGGTVKAVKNKWYSGENETKQITNEVYITGVNQQKINEYGSTKREVPATVKIKLPNGITRAEVYDEIYKYNNSEVETTTPKEVKIETINGQKYAIYNCTLKYSNYSFETPIKNDLYCISLHDYSYEDAYSVCSHIKIFSSNEQYKDYRNFC